MSSFVQLLSSNHAEEENDDNFKKILLYFFKTVFGTLCATCTVTGYASGADLGFSRGGGGRILRKFRKF